MSDVFTIKRGDTSPMLLYELIPSTIVLTGASVVFNMDSIAGVDVIDRAAATIEDDGSGGDADAPVVGYAFTAAQTGTAGLYNAEFEVTYSDGTIETFPNDEYILVKITDDLG